VNTRRQRAAVPTFAMPDVHIISGCRDFHFYDVDQQRQRFCAGT
jgi:hypothetical protein